MLYKSANVCESESYVRLSMYSAALKVGFFFLFLSLKAQNSIEITVKAFYLTKAMRN